jgi:hypothetical protein
MIVFRDGHYVQPELPHRQCSYPGCQVIVVGGFTCIIHRHYTAAELAMVDRKAS